MMPMLDYYVVGPSLVLMGQTSPSSATVALSVSRDGRRSIGSVTGEPRSDGIELTAHPAEDWSESEHIEALRLLARICSRTSPDEPLVLRVRVMGTRDTSLSEDGFRPTDSDVWVRSSEPFVRSKKATHMDQVYDSPFFIPWNFVPREGEVLDLLATDAGGAPDRVLDLGCGFGKNAVWLEQQGFEAYGIDISARAVSRCRELVAAPRRFLVSTASDLPYPTGFFDRVLDMGCLHCLPPEQHDHVVSEVARVLRPGGHIYSRSFKPRPADWVERQPFRADEFGVDGALSLWSHHFRACLWREDPDINYVKGLRP